jgi:uncharacterized RDD family membrane protein YckC
MARIVTTQNVIIHYETASIGERLLARLLDMVFMFAYLVICYWLLGEFMSLSNLEEAGKFASVIAILVPLPVLTYSLWQESFFNGRTVGKLIMGLKVVRTNGQPAGAGEFAYRWVLRILEGEISIFTCLALPVAIVSDKSQRIGDMVAGTIVIRTKQRSSLRQTILSQVNLNYRVVFPQVSNLSDRDINIIRDVMAQAFETGNYRLLEYLGQKVKDTIGVHPPPQQLPTQQFLNLVIADYTHYNFHGK